MRHYEQSLLLSQKRLSGIVGSDLVLLPQRNQINHRFYAKAEVPRVALRMRFRLGRSADQPWAVMVTATASTLRDSYCSLACLGPEARALSDPEPAAAVIDGADRPGGLSDARRLSPPGPWQPVRDPDSTSPSDIEHLGEVGLGDREISKRNDAHRATARALDRSTTHSAPYPTSSSPTTRPYRSGTPSARADRA
jgi:hypothetical protein